MTDKTIELDQHRGMAAQKAPELRRLRQQLVQMAAPTRRIGFVAPDASRAGYRSIHVDVPTHPDVAVRVRKGVDVSGVHTDSKRLTFLPQ